MPNQKTSFDYDLENDILFIYLFGKKSGSSIEYGKNIHISFSHGEVVALEFIDASLILSKLTEKKITKEMLGKIKKCSLYSEKTKGLQLINFSCIFSGRLPLLKHQLAIQDITNSRSLLTISR